MRRKPIVPGRTVLIGRIRKGARLFAIPTAEQENHGKVAAVPMAYGSALPTPVQLRQDSSIPWEKVEASAVGMQHQFEIKLIRDLRWKAAGADRTRRFSSSGRLPIASGKAPNSTVILPPICLVPIRRFRLNRFSMPTFGDGGSKLISMKKRH